jgi:hypothetical protein
MSLRSVRPSFFLSCIYQDVLDVFCNISGQGMRGLKEFCPSIEFGCCVGPSV